MEFEVKLPRFVTNYTNGENPVKVATEIDTIGGIITSLVVKYPALGSQLLDNGGLHKHLNVFVDLEDVRFLGGLELQLTSPDQKIDIIVAVAGG